MIGALPAIGGLSAVQTAMVIGALPFFVVMVLMAISLVGSVMKDSRASAQIANNLVVVEQAAE